MNNWNAYYCGLCEVTFAIAPANDQGDTSCPKCESGEDVYRITLEAEGK